jgi:hypothetical protein
MKPHFAFAILAVTSSSVFAQDIEKKAYVNCLLAHAIDEPTDGDEDKSVLRMVHKCNQEFKAALDECESSGAPRRVPVRQHASRR